MEGIQADSGGRMVSSKIRVSYKPAAERSLFLRRPQPVTHRRVHVNTADKPLRNIKSIIKQ